MAPRHVEEGDRGPGPQGLLGGGRDLCLPPQVARPDQGGVTRVRVSTRVYFGKKIRRLHNGICQNSEKD